MFKGVAILYFVFCQPYSGITKILLVKILKIFYKTAFIFYEKFIYYIVVHAQIPSFSRYNIFHFTFQRHFKQVAIA